MAALLLLVQLAGAPGANPPQRAVLEFILNEVGKGEILVFVEADEVWAPVEQLERAGLSAPAGRRRMLGGETHVALSSLAPLVRYELDERALALRLTASPEQLGTVVIDAGAGRPPGLIESRATSAFVNYAVSWGQNGGGSAVAEAGLRAGGALLLTSVARQATGALVRGTTRLTFDDRQRLRRWTAGDVYAHTGPLGGGRLLGGIALAREYSLDPYFVYHPTMSFAGAATTPSTVEIYVNDRMVRRQELAPGQFELRHLDVPAGRGTARVVIRDAFGREQQMVSPFYVTAAVLRRGLHEYRYSAGFERRQTGQRNWDYGSFAALGRHRVGITDSVTLGFRIEAAGGLVSGGPTLALRMPAGTLEIAGGASWQRQSETAGRSGMAASLAYGFASHRGISVGLAVTAADPRYRTLDTDEIPLRPEIEGHAYAGLSLGRAGSLTLQHAVSADASTGRRDRTTVSSSTRIAPRSDLLVSLSQVREAGRRHHEAFVGLSLSLGPSTMGSVSYQHRDAADRGASGGPALDLQRSLPVGTGWGYRLHADHTGELGTTGTVQYQGPHGRYEISNDLAGGRQAVTVTAAGAVVALGGRVFATRPVYDSFALIRVPELGGVRGYVSNQEVGRTNRHGDLFVPNLVSYYGNRLRIADQDIPLEYDLSAMEQTIAPPYRGGTVVSFPIRPLRALVGRLTVMAGGEQIVPARGQLRVTAGDTNVESPIGAAGEFYLENLAPGSYPAVVHHAGSPCRLTLRIPEATGLLVDLGTVVCELPDRSGQ